MAGPARDAHATSPGAHSRLVQSLVVAYTLGELPASWLVTFHRFERSIARAGFRVDVRLAPLEDLPEDGVDVLVVPPRLEAAARKLGTQAEIVVTSSRKAPAAVAMLLDRLREARELRADQLDPNAPRLVRYRGFMPV